jgi:hypothetical protein
MFHTHSITGNRFGNQCKNPNKYMLIMVGLYELLWKATRMALAISAMKYIDGKPDVASVYSIVDLTGETAWNFQLVFR